VSEAYFDDGTVTLYLGDCRELIPELGLTADLIVADPPYGETSLAWDRWPEGWVQTATLAAKSMWCFGSVRMFGEHWGEFRAAKWKMSQENVGADENGLPIRADLAVIWEKNAGTGIFTDRFRRIHENVLHWYRAPRWADVYHDAQRVPVGPTWTGRVARTNGSPVRSQRAGSHLGGNGPSAWFEDGTRLMTSIIRAAKVWRTGTGHPTEKPVDLLKPLIKYGCPEGGLVLDPFAGSGSTLDAARQTGRRAIGIELREQYAEKAARRLSQAMIGDDAA